MSAKQLSEICQSHLHHTIMIPNHLHYLLRHQIINKKLTFFFFFLFYCRKPIARWLSIEVLAQWVVDMVGHYQPRPCPVVLWVPTDHPLRQLWPYDLCGDRISFSPSKTSPNFYIYLNQTSSTFLIDWRRSGPLCLLCCSRFMQSPRQQRSA